MMQTKHRRGLMPTLAGAGLILLVCAAGFFAPSRFPSITHRPAIVQAGSAKPAPSRPVYPYSVIRGGAYSAAELTAALDRDEVAARHYQVFRRASVHLTGSLFSEPVFLSYRVGGEVYWTSRPVRVPRGETLLTDGQNYARARCGNRISKIPQTPVRDTEPEPETLDEPQPSAGPRIADLDAWSDNRLTTGPAPPFAQVLTREPLISAVPGAAPEGGIIPSWWLWFGGAPSGFPSISANSISPNLTPPGAVPASSAIEPNPIPGLAFPPIGFGPELPLPYPMTTTSPVMAFVPPGFVSSETWLNPIVPVGPAIPEVSSALGVTGVHAVPGASVAPGIETSLDIPLQPANPVRPAPEPALVLPTLLALAAIAAASFRRKR